MKPRPFSTAPPKTVVRHFSTIAKPFFARICGKIRESATIAAIRDAILPKPVNGKFKISELNTL